MRRASKDLSLVEKTWVSDVELVRETLCLLCLRCCDSSKITS